ncbi:unnamed protein product [Rotaria sp. Silwood2]|nr:unnamed protein product [Rotaria sp. Silwood2]CAF4210191.1 unnamed protein product [Rotaria sp. Silwood2]
MITRIETLSNEILLHIFSYLPRFDMLTSLWSLNTRFNSLVRSTLSRNNSISNTGILIIQGLSYNKCCSILFPLIINSSSLCSSIQRIHFDETNSSACGLIYEWLFNEKKILNFPNLKSLILTQSGSIEPVVQCLSYLVEYQLDELTLTFDNHVFKRFFYVKQHLSMASDIEKQMIMFKVFLCQLFSEKCHLISLRFDISNELTDGKIHRCLSSNFCHSSNLIQYQLPTCCLTLRHLHIRLRYACFLENLVEHVPNLEQISNVERLKQSNENWFNKIPKLRYFSLTTCIDDDLEFVYLKWLLNNLNYIEKLQVHLRNNKLMERKYQNIWRSVIDANFIRQYCLPDRIINLIYFDFYVCSQCQLSLNDIEQIINSFKIHSFFISHQWTNVKCLFDSITSCQHLLSSFSYTLQPSGNRINHSYIFNWPHIDKFLFHLHPSLYLFLEEFNDISPNIRCIKVYKGKLLWYFNDFLDC